MSGYLFHFTVYLMAMLGIIALAMITYKMLNVNTKFNSTTLSVTDSMKLTPKKTLYVVKAGEERFLIASDFDSTTLISKLGDTEMNIAQSVQVQREDKSVKLSSFDGLKSMSEFVLNFEQKERVKKPVMKVLARKLQSC